MNAQCPFSTQSGHPLDLRLIPGQVTDSFQPLIPANSLQGADHEKP
jgi:hypothetical protein